MAHLIDLHCHTSRYSSCSSLAPEQLIATARERGLDGVCLTEHDARWGDGEIAELAATTGMVILPGMEITSDAGHILAFGLPAELATSSFPALARNAQASGALLYLAHPARDGLLRLDAGTVAALASVEVLNGSDTAIQNMAAAGLAHRFPLPGTGGSDAHAPAEIGKAATRFEDDIRTEQDLLAALRAGRYAALTPSAPTAPPS